MLKEAFDCIYGKKSHMNITAKVLIGVPMLPFVVMFVFTFVLIDFFLQRVRNMNKNATRLFRSYPYD